MHPTPTAATGLEWDKFEWLSLYSFLYYYLMKSIRYHNQIKNKSHKVFRTIDIETDEDVLNKR